MNFFTNKEKGNTALGMAIAYFSSQGYTVSIPLNDTQDYDLIVEKDKKLQTVQVKSSGCKTNVDLLFIFLKDYSMYLIPKNYINNSSTITLTNKYVNFKVIF